MCTFFRSRAWLLIVLTCAPATSRFAHGKSSDPRTGTTPIALTREEQILKKLTTAMPPKEQQTGGKEFFADHVPASTQFPWLNNTTDGFNGRVFIDQPVNLTKLGPGTNIVFVFLNIERNGVLEPHYAWAVSNGRFDSDETNGRLDDHSFPMRIGKEGEAEPNNGKYTYPIDEYGNYFSADMLVTSNTVHGRIRNALLAAFPSRHWEDAVAGHVAIGTNEKVTVGYVSGLNRYPDTPFKDPRALPPTHRDTLHGAMGIAFKGRNIDEVLFAAPVVENDIIAKKAEQRFPLTDAVTIPKHAKPELDFITDPVVREALDPDTVLSKKSTAWLSDAFSRYPHLGLGQRILYALTVYEKQDRASRALGSTIIDAMRARDSAFADKLQKLIAQDKAFIEFISPETLEALKAIVHSKDQSSGLARQKAAQCLVEIAKARPKDKATVQNIVNTFADVIVAPDRLNGEMSAPADLKELIAHFKARRDLITPEVLHALALTMKPDDTKASKYHRSQGISALELIFQYHPGEAEYITPEILAAMETFLKAPHANNVSPQLQSDIAIMLRMIGIDNAKNKKLVAEVTRIMLEVMQGKEYTSEARCAVARRYAEMIRLAPENKELVSAELLKVIEVILKDKAADGSTTAIRDEAMGILRAAAGVRTDRKEFVPAGLREELRAIAESSSFDHDYDDLRAYAQWTLREIEEARTRQKPPGRIVETLQMIFRGCAAALRPSPG